MKVRFLGDANFNRRIVAGLLRREPAVDFVLPEAMIPERMKDPDVLDLADSTGRIVVSHDVRTMPRWFDQCVEQHQCAGLILVPNKLPIRDVIEDLLLIWHVTEADQWVNRLEWLPL
ncbi:MAG: DUF5615 family PIN-like protein [Acidobacteriia bacterium]|nr:DUF5615 family PIN-like protein [Terriglobia bacterium]